MERFMIVGLGNPGKKYANTRHNVGFRCVDALATYYNLRFDIKKGKAKVANGSVDGHNVLLVKPQTYMNLSGHSVSVIANFYKVPPENIIVIFDDMDLPLGTLRIRNSGGSSGQKGVKSIIERIGTRDFNRIRFGISRPPGRMDPAAYVLLPFSHGDDEILVNETIDRVRNAVLDWLNDGINRAMNNQNGSQEDIANRERKHHDQLIAKQKRKEAKQKRSAAKQKQLTAQDSSDKQPGSEA